MKMAALIFNALSLLREAFNHLKPYPTKTKYCLPLPPKCHVVITEEEIRGRPILIVGDVHGCYDELKDLVTQAKDVVNTSDLYIVFVGDMLNKGPKNFEVLTYIRELTVQGKAAAVKGNHEESLLREHRSMSQDKDYKLPPKYQYLSRFSDDDFKYLQNLPYTLTIPTINSIVVHAGLVPGVPIERQSLVDLSHMRNLVYETCLWGKVAVGHSKPTLGVPWASQWDGPQHVYYGHDARRGLQTYTYATGLDTGCVYGHSLTGIVISPAAGIKQLISIPAKETYYAT